MALYAVESHLLVDVVWVSLLASIAISVLFSSVIVGTVRATDARRDGRSVVAAGWYALAVLCAALFAAGVVLGVQAMITK
jgi:hypothetical protein